MGEYDQVLILVITTIDLDLCEVALTIESVDKILKCDHSNEHYCPVVLFIMLYKVVLTSF